jgi:hypothetical protein
VRTTLWLSINLELGDDHVEPVIGAHPGSARPDLEDLAAAWWVRRSMRVTMQVALGKTVFQSLKARLGATCLKLLLRR